MPGIPPVTGPDIPMSKEKDPTQKELDRFKDRFGEVKPRFNWKSGEGSLLLPSQEGYPDLRFLFTPRRWDPSRPDPDGFQFGIYGEYEFETIFGTKVKFFGGFNPGTRGIPWPSQGRNSLLYPADPPGYPGDRPPFRAGGGVEIGPRK
jgi:hypothetical protein